MMTLEQARGIAATAWCKENTKNKVMDVDLAEAFANILIDQEFGKLADKMYKAMDDNFPHAPDAARGAARVAIGVLIEAQLR